MSLTLKNSKGFTLVELMIVTVITSVVMTALHSFYTSYRDRVAVQDQVTDIQQTMRAAIYLLTQEFRSAGYDPTESRLFGITDVTFQDINMNPDTTATGYSTLTFTQDLDEDGVVDANEVYTYSLFDFPVATPDGDTDLSRTVGGAGRTMFAENIEAFSLAYAYDVSSDGDSALDLSGGQIIWAIDSDNNNTLDKNLDSNTDGRIDENDQAGAGNRLIVGSDIIPAIDLDDIRAIRVWVLVKSDRPDMNYLDTNTYVVGRHIIVPNDNFRRRLLEATVYCRNMGLL